MKKSSKAVHLVLISSLLASCNKTNSETETITQKVYMRADTTAQYTDVTQQYKHPATHSNSTGNALLWYMAFRHLGGNSGYASQGLHTNSVVGTNNNKTKAYETTKRSGFGNTAKEKESSSAS